MIAAELFSALRTGRWVIEIGELALGECPHDAALPLPHVRDSARAGGKNVEPVCGHGSDILDQLPRPKNTDRRCSTAGQRPAPLEPASEFAQCTRRRDASPYGTRRKP